MITSLTTRYRVVFALSLVLCVLLVSGVPVDAKRTSLFVVSGGKNVQSDNQYHPFEIKEQRDNYVASTKVDNGRIIESNCIFQRKPTMNSN